MLPSVGSLLKALVCKLLGRNQHVVHSDVWATRSGGAGQSMKITEGPRTIHQHTLLVFISLVSICSGLIQCNPLVPL